jgi:hypothetical protein
MDVRTCCDAQLGAHGGGQGDLAFAGDGGFYVC